MIKVKDGAVKRTRIGNKHQVTIPVDTLRAAGLAVGDRVTASCDGMGRILLQREHDILAEFAGALTGVYAPDELAALRDEWV
ncbi:MAG: AbrB/MazE/SpoVT family DNA-binding domain-containing protein [Gemmatimonadaceae bacterium]|nr:AbrB/MazE/SpoVT family DNA-binding domain-containing protein [Gemmatimonadaceae bacterium]